MKFSAGSNALIDAMIETAQRQGLSQDDIMRGLMGSLYSAMAAGEYDNAMLFDSDTGECLLVVVRHK